VASVRNGFAERTAVAIDRKDNEPTRPIAFHGG
jgi:hypothetical protein